MTIDTLALTTPRTLEIQDLGTRSFQEVWELQRNYQQAVIRAARPDTLILCQHLPVITAGTSTKENSLQTSQELLQKNGIQFFKIERGGDITYHGPGQIVAYPIINLNNHRRDVHWYMRTLEQVIINTLGRFNLNSDRFKGRTGVWVQDAEITEQNPPRKIASIGVRISRWCTMHGFALNVADCSAGFGHIHPCGFNDIVVTSMEQERLYQHSNLGSPISVEQAKAVLQQEFCSVFNYSIEPQQTLIN